MKLIELKGLIDMETGAPMPIVISSSSKTVISFNKQPSDDFESPDAHTKVYESFVYSVKFRECIYHKFGIPNDEALYGHPYYKLGLSYYSFYELKDSDLIKELINIEKCHPNFNLKYWSSYSHYILTFHDNMFECIALGFDITLVKNTVQEQSLALFNEFFLSA